MRSTGDRVPASAAGGGGVERAYAAVRSRVSTLAEDRVLGPDIEALAAAVGAGAFA